MTDKSFQIGVPTLEPTPDAGVHVSTPTQQISNLLYANGILREELALLRKIASTAHEHLFELSEDIENSSLNWWFSTDGLDDVLSLLEQWKAKHGQ